MLRLLRLKIIKQKTPAFLLLLPTILFILGCIYALNANNFLSFIFSVSIPVLLVLNSIIGIYWLFTKNKLFLLALAGNVLFLNCFDLFFQLNDTQNKDKNNVISVMSYNTKNFGLVSGVIKNNTYRKIIDFINNKNPDIVVIQEFWDKGLEPFSNYPYRFLGYRKNIEKCKQVILSKYPIINEGYLDFTKTNNNAMFVDISINKEIIRVYNLHLESYRTASMHKLNNPKNYISLIKRISNTEKIRKEQAFLVNAHSREFNGKVIISGDFNATQFSSTYNILKSSRKDSFIEKGSGFGSTYDLFNYPFRIDYLLVDDRFEVLSHENFDIKFSDHEPILVKLKVN